MLELNGKKTDERKADRKQFEYQPHHLPNPFEMVYFVQCNKFVWYRPKKYRSEPLFRYKIFTKSGTKLKIRRDEERNDTKTKNMFATYFPQKPFDHFHSRKFCLLSLWSNVAYRIWWENEHRNEFIIILNTLNVLYYKAYQPTCIWWNCVYKR